MVCIESKRWEMFTVKYLCLDLQASVTGQSSDSKLVGAETFKEKSTEILKQKKTAPEASFLKFDLVYNVK